MNKELLKLKKIISNLQVDQEHIQGKKLNEIMTMVRSGEITFEDFVKEFKTII